MQACKAGWSMDDLLYQVPAPRRAYAFLNWTIWTYGAILASLDHQHDYTP